MVSSSLATYSDLWTSVPGTLYCIPIVIAAIMLSARSAMIVALAAGGIQMLVAGFSHRPALIPSIAETVLFLCVAVTAAKLAHWRARTRRTVLDRELLAVDVDRSRNKTEPDVLSRVVFGLVRQFRTPVSSIEGAGWILDDPELPEDKRRELVAVVRNEAHRLSRVLSDVLEYTEPRPPRFSSVDVSTLLEDVIRLGSLQHSTHSWAFSKDIAPNLPALRGDPEQLTQALMNIIANSMQAMPDGGQIQVSADLVDSKVVIRVKDHGPGIAAEAMDRLFEPFFTTHDRSLGLGLPTALRIVSEHGGNMTLDSREGAGTAMSVVLPVSPAPASKYGEFGRRN